MIEAAGRFDEDPTEAWRASGGCSLLAQASTGKLYSDISDRVHVQMLSKLHVSYMATRGNKLIQMQMPSLLLHLFKQMSLACRFQPLWMVEISKSEVT